MGVGTWVRFFFFNDTATSEIYTLSLHDALPSEQRKLSLEEYRTTYLQVPKIVNRKPVFVSETVRDELDRVVRFLGGKGMSASGLIENLVRLHLDTYRNDIEQWRKL
mgnify:CR=1 FL=1